MINKCQSLLVAENIINLVNYLLTDEEHEPAWIECFDNCREQGLVITTFEKKIAVTECRNSDEICVYVYKKTRHPSNLPAKDKDWENVKRFKYNQYTLAAEYVVKQIKVSKS